MPNKLRIPTRGLSFRVKRAICFFLLVCAFMAVKTEAQAKRPQIGGITSVTFFASNISADRDFFARTVDPTLYSKLSAKDAVEPFVATLPSGQTIQVTRTEGNLPNNLLANVTLITDSISKLAHFLKSKNIEFKLYKDRDVLTLLDPEGNRISFVGGLLTPRPLTGQEQIYLNNRAQAIREHGQPIPHSRIIHAGFIVHDRNVMEHFYKDILGFRPYWYGGMKDDETTWVSLQVPDGTAWLEFMLNVPDNADKHLRGVMNHIALGVTDIQAAKAQLIKNGLTLTEEPKLGRDGKWQLNLYDPDETRIEFMEFTPSRPPCCSEFTAPHPKP